MRHSSCTWAGMPNRLAAITSRCRSARIGSPSAGSTGAVPNGAGQLAEAVRDRLLPRRQRARASRSIGAISAGVRVEPPDARTAGRPSRSTVIRATRSATRSSTGAGRRATRSVTRSLLGLGDRRTTRVVPRVTCVFVRPPSPAISATSMATASCPIWRMGCCDGGQRRIGERRLGDVVEADDGQVAGTSMPSSAADLEDRQRREVVGREDRGRRLRQAQQRPCAASRACSGSKAPGASSDSSTSTPAAACASRKPCSRSWADTRSGAAGDHADPGVAEARAGARRRAGRPAGCPR